MLELALVVVIIGIISAIAIPRYAGAMSRHRLNLAADRVEADLEFARRQARLASSQRTVVFSSSLGVYRMTDLPGLDDPDATYEVRLGDEPYGVEIVKANLGGDQEIVFDGFGVPDSGGAIVLSAGGFQMTVTVDDAAGRTSRVLTDVREIAASPVPVEPTPKEVPGAKSVIP